MRFKLYFFVGILLAAGIGLRAQQGQVLLPEQSTAKAREIINLGIQALGGSAYLNVRDATCEGTVSQFEHSGNLSGFDKFVDYNILPDKDRQENIPKRNLIQVFNGDKGWILDRGGVQDAPEDSVKQFQDDLQKDIDYILRHRLDEKGMLIRYAGEDVVDNFPAEWVEMTDSEDRTIRIAFSASAQALHLPIRKVVAERDPSTNLRIEETDIFSIYHVVEGIATPFQVSRERNGQRVFQIFVKGCKYNTGLQPSLFTKESLEKRWSEVGKKSKKKKEKDKDKDKDNEG